MPNCHKCGSQLDGEVKFCAKCGANVEDEYVEAPVCPKCRATYPSGTKFCAADGSKLVAPEKLLPKCVKCGKVFDQSVQFCPDDGARVIPEALRSSGLSISSADLKQFSQISLADTSAYDSIITTGYSTDIGGWLSKAWAVVSKDLLLYIAYGLVLLVLGAITGAGFRWAGRYLFSIFSSVFSAGFFAVALKRARGGEPVFGDFFSVFSKALPIVLASILMSALVGIGTVLLIIPGVYLFVSYTFTHLLIIDGDLDFWQAMETSRKVVTRNWSGIFLFLLVLGLLNLAGLLALGVGFALTYPWSMAAVTVAYMDIFTKGQ